MAAIKSMVHDGWHWKQRDLTRSLNDDIHALDGWTKCKSFPSEIHVELAHAGKIPDPYVGFNEHSVQCTLVKSIPDTYLDRICTRGWRSRMAVFYIDAFVGFPWLFSACSRIRRFRYIMRCLFGALHKFWNFTWTQAQVSRTIISS
jgi:hypothetical protein